MSASSYDVIVIGGGHAGSESNRGCREDGRKNCLDHASARHDRRNVLQSGHRRAWQGHLVREIDAMDGLMGRIADAAGIQFRMLNKKKGAAVRGPRTQADRKLYRLAMLNAIEAIENLDVIEGDAFDLDIKGNRVAGVIMKDGGKAHRRPVGCYYDRHVPSGTYPYRK